MKKRVESHIILRNARILFPNFAGREDRFNPAGKRNFNVIIDDAKMAQDLIADGWNVREVPPRDEGGDPTYRLKVNVNFNGPRPPKIVQVTSTNKVRLTEDLVGTLDYADIEKVDVDISPYNYDANGRTGVSGYLQTMYVTIKEDPFEAEYSDRTAPDEEVPF